jgi:hypothetical protein
MENAFSLVWNMWKVHTRPTSASDFFIMSYVEELGLQIFVKMKLKLITYSPEHKTKRFRSIKVIVIFGGWFKLANLEFLTKTDKYIIIQVFMIFI